MKDIKVTLDLNFQFKGPDGNPASSRGNPLAPANELVANFLFNGYSPDKSDKARNRAWSAQLYLNGKIDVDKKQMVSILDCCSNGAMADGFYCQLEDLIESKKEEWDSLKEEAKKEKAE